MNKAIRILCLFVLVFAIVGCENEVVPEAFVQEEDVSLTHRGVVIFKYDGNTCQLSYNDKRHEFKAMHDDMAHYFILKCDADLSEIDQSVIAQLSYTTSDNLKVEKNLSFKVIKIDQSRGLIWLWNNTKKLGLVVRKI